MKRMILIAVLSALLTVGFVLPPSGVPEATAQNRIDYQKTADSAKWGWSAEKSHPLGCVSQCGHKYDILLLNPCQSRYSLTITILEGTRKVYTWSGNTNSVFRIIGDRLYYARFSTAGSGGTVVAVDLSTGKELWSSRLKALGSFRYSSYRTLLNLDANYDSVSVYGNESRGRYIEIKDAETGRTIGHKIFPEEKKGHQAGK